MIGFAVLAGSTVMALSLAGGGSSNAGTSGGDGLGRDDGRSCCPTQGGCGSEKGSDGCPVSTACSSKGQCSSQTKGCGSEGGPCGGCDKSAVGACPAQAGCGSEKGCDGCPVSTACSSKGQCSSQTKGCGSVGGPCGGCDKAAVGDCPAQAGCGSEKGCDGCPVSTACSSKGQCSSRVKGCGSEGGPCGGCSSEEGKCDTTKCLECPLAGDCDKVDLTKLGVANMMVPPLPQSSDDEGED
jgi:hypothetical protein